MKKRLYLVHAWDESPQSCWYQWLKRQLEAQGFEVHVPVMPNPAAPELAAWVGTLNSAVAEPDKNTYFVGHSVGCQTILRYLAGLGDDQHVGGAVFVAPWTQLVGLGEASMHIAKPWIETPLDWQAATSRCPQFTALFSDNDGWVPLAEEKTFQAKLGAKTQIVRGAGHFDGIAELPKALKEVLRMTEAKIVQPKS